jgi:hypothetical protein
VRTAARKVQGQDLPWKEIIDSGCPRKGEVVRLGPQHVRNGRIRIEGTHGSEDVDIPFLDVLSAQQCNAFVAMLGAETLDDTPALFAGVGSA